MSVISFPKKIKMKKQLQNKIDNKTKPLGSLGMLENIALQIGLIQETLTPNLTNPTMFVFAADHGLTDEGVSPFPKVVTQQMVLNFIGGGAAISVFCKQNGLKLYVVDAGVDADFDCHPDLIISKIKKGTNNILKQPAMSIDECKEMMNRGANLIEKENQKECNVVAFGEMGIGNTSSAALLMSKFCNIPIEKCTGRGTGHDDEGLKKKIAILQKAIATHNIGNDPIEILSTFGGFEISMMVGAMLKAAELKMIILVDGFICSSAILTASRINNKILDNSIFCHKSREAGHIMMLEFLNAKPLLDINMRLGEGSGAAVAFPLIQSSVNFLNDMASFEDAGVSNKE